VVLVCALLTFEVEDLIEEIIGEEIVSFDVIYPNTADPQVDETDRVQDNQSKKAVKRNTTAAVMRKLSIPGALGKADIQGVSSKDNESSTLSLDDHL